MIQIYRLKNYNFVFITGNFSEKLQIWLWERRITTFFAMRKNVKSHTDEMHLHRIPSYPSSRPLSHSHVLHPTIHPILHHIRHRTRYRILHFILYPMLLPILRSILHLVLYTLLYFIWSKLIFHNILHQILYHRLSWPLTRRSSQILYHPLPHPSSDPIPPCITCFISNLYRITN